jgi:hypothetical protein
MTTTAREIVGKLNYFEKMANFSSDEYIQAILANKAEYAEEMLSEFVKFSSYTSLI